MANDYFTSASIPQRHTLASMTQLKSEFGRVERATNKLPVLSGNNGNFVTVNGAGNRLLADETGFPQSYLFSENGYFKFPGEGGFVLQWCHSEVTYSEPMTLTLPVSFENNILGAIGIIDQYNPANAWAATLLNGIGIDYSASDLSSVVVRARSRSGTSAVTDGWFVGARIFVFGN